MRRNDTPEWIVTNFCTGVGVHDVITSANFYDCRLWGLSVVGGQIFGFSIDSRCRPYNTRTTVRVCDNNSNKAKDIGKMVMRDVFFWNDGQMV